MGVTKTATGIDDRGRRYCDFYYDGEDLDEEEAAEAIVASIPFPRTRTLFTPITLTAAAPIDNGKDTAGSFDKATLATVLEALGLDSESDPRAYAVRVISS